MAQNRSTLITKKICAIEKNGFESYIKNAYLGAWNKKYFILLDSV